MVKTGGWPCRRLVPVAALWLTAVALSHPAGAAVPAAGGGAPWEWSGVPRVVAVGDLHGNRDKLVRLLEAAELIDGDQTWRGGEAHLVVAGDILDRGLDDRPLMDLLRRLEHESRAAGGRVHVLLGNHEVMNLFWDLRYVNPASYRHFAPEERKGDRRSAAGQFARLSGGDWKAAGFRRFNQSFPPGFFARQASLSPEGEYGRWLIGLPAVVKINDIVYTHGGLSEPFAALGLDGINHRVTRRISEYLEAREVLVREGVVVPVMNVLQVANAAQQVVDRKRADGELRQAAEALLEAANDPILGGQGPLWYRGNALQDERLERDIVDRVLDLLDARALVVAHSPTTSQRITSRFHDRLFRIDHGIGDADTPLALIAEEGETLVLDAATRETTRPQPEFPLGQLGASRGEPPSDETLREFLSSATPVAARTLGRGSTRPQLVVLERDGEIRRAIFKTVQSDGGEDRYQHEIAAYRLDRLLGLEMVPVTVPRELAGRTGSLQSWVDGALDQETADGYNLDFFTSERKLSQLLQVRAFDALIGNPARKPADILALVKEGTILLIDHSRAFSTSPELPAQLGPLESLPAELIGPLSRLDRATVEARLGALISAPQIDALLARRDKLLARLRPDEQESS